MLQPIQQDALEPLDVVFERPCPGYSLELAPLDAAAFRVAFGGGAGLGGRARSGGLLPLEGFACLLGLACLPREHSLGLSKTTATSRSAAHPVLLTVS
jgi:hypothetical protein